MQLGFVGLGAMGQLIVLRLMAAGHTVTGWNRSRNKAVTLLEGGMLWADSPREVAEQSEIVFSIVTDAAAVEAVALGPDGIVSGLRNGAIYIDMSTIGCRTTSRAVAAQFSKAHLTMLDGPISGSPVTVTAGNASMMIGGDEAAFERARPVLLAIGPKVTRIGNNGLACQMKIAVNLLLMVEVIASGEAIALAEQGGVDRAVAVDAVLKSVAASPVLGYRGPSFSTARCRKYRSPMSPCSKRHDAGLELGRKLGSPVPLAAAANEMMNACRGLGIDHKDFVAAQEVYRRLGGQDLGGQS